MPVVISRYYDTCAASRKISPPKVLKLSTRYASCNFIEAASAKPGDERRRISSLFRAPNNEKFTAIHCTNCRSWADDAEYFRSPLIKSHLLSKMMPDGFMGDILCLAGTFDWRLALHTHIFLAGSLHIGCQLLNYFGLLASLSCPRVIFRSLRVFGLSPFRNLLRLSPIGAGRALISRAYMSRLSAKRYTPDIFFVKTQMRFIYFGITFALMRIAWRWLLSTHFHGRFTTLCASLTFSKLMPHGLAEMLFV